jgi:hypothetical protein
MQRWIILVIVVMTVGFASGSYLTYAQGPAKPQPATDEAIAAATKAFAGKVVVLFQPGTADSSTAINDATFSEIAGRRFLSGKYATAPGEETLKGAPIHVAWETVNEFLILTPEQYKEWLESELGISAGANTH